MVNCVPASSKMSENAEKRRLKKNFQMQNWQVKTFQISIQIFYSFFDFHGECSNIQSQNLYYTMEALCAYQPVCR